ncbi:MAG: hypothetical protein M3169_02410 [Candidatus Eremiobacteraeota bacterium]|nr:hypothetical protein [Candidatus Eremiobacteraeota bacterium]
MRRPFWEIAAFALPLLLGLVLCAVDVVRPFGPGTVGLERSRYVPGPFVVRVESLRDGTPATRAGIRAGDELRVGAPRPAFALRTVKAGQTIGVVAAGGGAAIPLRADPAPHTVFPIEWVAIRIVVLIVTAVLIVGRPRDRSVRALALFLLSIGLMCDWWTYPPALAVAGMVLRLASGAIGFPALIAFVLDLAHGTAPDALARRARAMLPAVWIAYAALVALKNGLLYGAGYYLVAADAAIGICNAAFFVVAALLLASYALRASERERQQAAWIALSFVVALAGGVTYLVAGLVVAGGAFWGDVAALAIAVLPAGLAYAILRHRLLDISFAIDQAVAYSIATFALLVVFTGMDFLAKSKFEGDPDKRTFANIIAAGAVLFVIKIVHTRVNHYVRLALFRRRMERLAKLRAFAKDLRFFDEPAQLERELVHALDETLDHCGCAYYVRNGTRLVRIAGTDGTAESIDLNDAAILRVQSTGAVARVGELHSNLPAAYAFPVIVRGGLGGVVLLGNGDSLRSYAPDEIAAIQDVVTTAGDTHHVLRAYAASI